MKHTLNNAKEEVISHSHGFLAGLKNLGKLPGRLAKTLLHVPLDYLKTGWKGGMGFVNSYKKDVIETLTAQPEDTWFKKHIGRKLLGGTKIVFGGAFTYLLYKPFATVVYSFKGLGVAGANLIHNTAGSIVNVFKPSQEFAFSKESWKNEAVVVTEQQISEQEDNLEIQADTDLATEQVEAPDVTTELANGPAPVLKKSALELAHEGLDKAKTKEIEPSLSSKVSEVKDDAIVTGMEDISGKSEENIDVKKSKIITSKKLPEEGDLVGEETDLTENKKRKVVSLPDKKQKKVKKREISPPIPLAEAA